jgi:hypothetical protein
LKQDTEKDRGNARITLTWIINKDEVILGGGQNSISNMSNAGF